MNIRRIIIMMALALVVSTGAQAQSRRPRKGGKARTTTTARKPRVPDDFKGTGAGVYDLDADLPEDAASKKGATVSRDTIRSSSDDAVLIPTAEIDENFQLQAEASSPLDKVEVCDAQGKVLRSMGLHRGTKATIDLNAFPKDQTLVFKFYGVNGKSQNIELSH